MSAPVQYIFQQISSVINCCITEAVMKRIWISPTKVLDSSFSK